MFFQGVYQAATLKRWIDKRPDLNHPYLIWNPSKKAKNEPVTIRTFQRWCKISDPNLKSHDLRRSYATYLYSATGNNVKAVQKALGHSSIAITSRYLFLDDEKYQDTIRDAMKG
ncbi:MAG: site-specific integrase [Candidatus Hodarchaeota archaeon]